MLQLNERAKIIRNEPYAVDPSSSGHQKTVLSVITALAIGILFAGLGFGLLIYGGLAGSTPLMMAGGGAIGLVASFATATLIFSIRAHKLKKQYPSCISDRASEADAVVSDRVVDTNAFVFDIVSTPFSFQRNQKMLMENFCNWLKNQNGNLNDNNECIEVIKDMIVFIILDQALKQTSSLIKETVSPAMFASNAAASIASDIASFCDSSATPPSDAVVSAFAAVAACIITVSAFASSSAADAIVAIAEAGKVADADADIVSEKTRAAALGKATAKSYTSKIKDLVAKAQIKGRYDAGAKDDVLSAAKTAAANKAELEAKGKAATAAANDHAYGAVAAIYNVAATIYNVAATTFDVANHMCIAAAALISDDPHGISLEVAGSAAVIASNANTSVGADYETNIKFFYENEKLFYDSWTSKWDDDDSQGKLMRTQELIEIYKLYLINKKEQTLYIEQLERFFIEQLERVLTDLVIKPEDRSITQSSDY